jgi:hypothetical protein
MSYDYSLFKAPGPGPMESWPVARLDSLGTVDALKQKLSELFPGINWTNSHDTWFGRWQGRERHAEFQITPERGDDVQSFTMRRTERKEVERLCNHLGVVAVDPQKMELYSNLTGSWSQAR